MNEEAKRGSHPDDLILFRLDQQGKQLEHIEGLLREEYVSHEEFKTVRNIVYGMVGIILVTVLVAFLGTVIFHPAVPMPPAISVRP